ncbi:response regulator [Paenibacillus sp. UNC451MF]|uniref:response regulator n=1 Tax=Paenibacillus sp. UNC451MF TaxID=1449063 RepID=UPI00068DC398|nr:response regulator [Paenibacillus sp. UNC451MF]
MRSLSIRNKMMILVSLITSISLLFIGISSYRTAKQQIVNALQENATAKVLSRSYNLSAWIETKLAEVEVMSRTSQVRYGTDSERMDYLRKEVERSKGVFYDLGFAELGGSLTMTSGDVMNISTSSTFLKVLQGTSVVSDVFRGSTPNSGMLFTLQVPVYGENDKMIGIISALMSVESSFRLHTDFRVGNSDTIMMFTRDGTIIYHPDAWMVGYANIKHTDSPFKSIVTEILTNEYGYTQVMRGKEEQLIFYSSILGTPWHMVLQVPIQEFEKPLGVLLVKTVLTIMVMEFVMLWLITVLFNREILRIREITSITAQAAEGQFDITPIEVHNEDEISTLASSVNGMMVQLKLLFERLEAIINQNDFAIISLDSNYTINYFSKSAEKLLGYTAEEVLNKETPLLFHDPEQIQEVAKQLTEQLGRPVAPDLSVFKELRNNQFAYDRNWYFIRKDGSRVAVSHNSNGIRDRAGRFIGVVAISRDITEQIRMQQELVHAKLAAEEADSAKGAFLARMSHEIRTPLNGIIGLSQLMHKTELSDVQSDYLRNITASSQTLLRIINDILDFSKMEAGKFELDHIVFHLEDSIHRLSETISVFLGGKEQFEFIIETPERMPNGLIGDPLRLEQVLLNLCSNAVKFTPKGQVVVKIELVEELHDSVLLQISVNDTGVGISRELMDHLFEPFTQADGSMSRKFGGTGLGLVISSFLIEKMGGTLEVDSEFGVGSSFHFTIRFKRSKQSEAISYRLSEPEEIPVWIVEDNTAMREHLCTMLQSYGLKPYPMCSWKEAYAKLQLAAQSDPQCRIAVMDMEMPDMYGPETWKAFQKAAGAAGMITLAMTTVFGREEMLGMSVEDRPDGIILKPFSRPELFRTIEAALDRYVAPGEEHGEKDRRTTDRSKAIVSAKRILLVEDNEINQQVAYEMLHQHGYEVEVAGNGKEALLKLEQSEWDLVLMDVHMPEMDGCEATQVIRSIPRFEHIPIIAMTANVIRNDHEKYMQIGMNDIITKPLEIEPMFATLRKWLRDSDNHSVSLTSEGSAAEVSDSLPSLEGIDVRRVVNRLNGRVSIFRQMIKTFERDYVDFIAQLQHSLQEGKANEALRLVHTLKGAAGNLAAGQLETAASRLETVMLATGAVDPLSLEKAMEEVEHCLEQLLASIHSSH